MAASAILIAPTAVFLAVVAFAVGMERYSRAGSILVRRHLSAFVATTSVPQAGASGVAVAPPLKQSRFSSISGLDRLLRGRRWGERTSLELARAALPLRAGEYVLLRLTLALGALLAVSAAGSMLLGLVAAALAYAAPAVIVRRRTERRVRLFDAQLVEGLALVNSALKSGYSFQQAMQALADEIPDPLGVEFAEALREIRMGKPVEDALIGIADRVRSQDFELVVTAMVIQRHVGGNLTEVLANIAQTVRERHRILREVRTLTAEERMSGNIVAGLPVALLLLLTLISPGYVGGMMASTGGKGMLAAGALLELLGLLIIRQIVAIEV